MIKEKVMVTAMFFVFFMICFSNLVIAEDENIILTHNETLYSSDNTKSIKKQKKPKS